MTIHLGWFDQTVTMSYMHCCTDTHCVGTTGHSASLHPWGFYKANKTIEVVIFVDLGLSGIGGNMRVLVFADGKFGGFRYVVQRTPCSITQGRGEPLAHEASPASLMVTTRSIRDDVGADEAPSATEAENTNS